MKPALGQLREFVYAVANTAKVRKRLMAIAAAIIILQLYFVRELIAAELLFGLGFAVMLVLAGVLYVVGAIGELALSSLRQQIAMVSQHVVLFDDTVAANIAYGDKAPDAARIEAAAAAAHMTDTIAALPLGMQTQIGDNGSRLSGGQRQRLAIARAIYKDAPILILDEATSALDSESERAVQAALDKLMEGRTTLVIAHRLSTIERASRIVVLVGGSIVEIGTHQELLAKDGAYANLYHLQFAKGEGEIVSA